MKKTIYDLELHESLELGFTGVLRVAGGWIYNYWNTEKDTFNNGTFVPYSDEFKTEKS